MAEEGNALLAQYEREVKAVAVINGIRKELEANRKATEAKLLGYKRAHPEIGSEWSTPHGGKIRYTTSDNPAKSISFKALERAVDSFDLQEKGRGFVAHCRNLVREEGGKNKKNGQGPKRKEQQERLDYSVLLGEDKTYTPVKDVRFDATYIRDEICSKVATQQMKILPPPPPAPSKRQAKKRSLRNPSSSSSSSSSSKSDDLVEDEEL